MATDTITNSARCPVQKPSRCMTADLLDHGRLRTTAARNSHAPSRLRYRLDAAASAPATADRTAGLSHGAYLAPDNLHATVAAPGERSARAGDPRAGQRKSTMADRMDPNGISLRTGRLPDSLPDGASAAWRSAEATLARSRTFVHDPAAHHRHDRPDVPDLVGGNREVVAVEDHQIG